MRPIRGQHRLGPPGEDPPPFRPGTPVWGPPPPGGWDPPPPGGWDPRGPPPPDWNSRGPRHWDPRGPPYWDPRDPRGPPPPDWDPLGPPYPGMDPSWYPPPDPRHQYWAAPREDFPPWQEPRFPPPSGYMHPPARAPPGPSMPPQTSVPPFGYLPVPPPGWTPEPITEEPMPNPPPEQPEWIKALLCAPPNEAPKTTVAAIPVEASPPEAPPPSKPEVNTTPKALGLLGARTFDRPPSGRSTGIISFIGPMFGYIEREDLERFTFKFNVFFGTPKAMRPGVRVHFTACKQKDKSIATDVKVAPGGTENVDPEILEGVVSQPIIEPEPGERQYPGKLLVTSGALRTNLTFERKDSNVSLLKDDKVLFNLLTDIVSDKKRATNIRPKIPTTFTHTLETRHKGVIVSLNESVGVVKSEDHGELAFDFRENLSDMDFSSEDVGEEVEFTLIELKVEKKAVRIKRVKEPLLLALCIPNTSPGEWQTVPSGRTITQAELEPHMKLDTELYEGIVSQPIVRPTDSKPGDPGQIHANIGAIRTNVTFDLRDCSVTLLKNDHVLINLLIDTQTGKKSATNIRAKVPFTFSYTKETRNKGVITNLDGKEGIVKSDEFGELPFDVSENFSDTEFLQEDLQKEVEFTVLIEESKKKAIRLKRLKKLDDPILRGQKKRKEEEQRKQENNEREDKKEAVAAALVAARNKWTPMGFTFNIPNTLEDISRERFEGTILQTPIAKQSMAHIKVEAEVESKASEGHQKVKVEPGEEGGTKEDLPTGRLVMTLDGTQKQLSFGLRDVISYSTMLVGDKVRFNIATNQETKECRAMYVEILPDSFEESNEQRHQGIVIEITNSYGLIKCSQNEQLFFSSSEVIERKKLALNEKVDFTIVPHESAGGGQQAIRIRRYVESVFLPARKFGGSAETKGKMTIKLAMSTEDFEKKKQEANKMKAVVKNLRSQDSKAKSSTHSSKTHSTSPSKDHFGRVPNKRRSLTVDRDSKRSRRTNSRERSRRRSRSRSASRSRKRYHRRSRSPKPLRKRSLSSDSRSRSCSREKDRDKSSRKRVREHEDSQKRKSPPNKQTGVMEEELAQKKRELEELNDMIAYKKSLMDLRGQDPGQKACIDYDHGRIAIPLTEYKPVRSILKNRADESNYPPRPSYEDPYSKPYSQFEEQHYSNRYGDTYADRPYGDRLYSDQPYSDRPYESHLYEDLPHPPLKSQYTDPYKDYDQSFKEHYYDPYDPYDPPQRSQSLEPKGGFPSCGSSQEHMSTNETASSHTVQASNHSSPPTVLPTRGSSMDPHHSPPAEKPPLDRFLEMLNKKNLTETEPMSMTVMDDLLPHERAFQDGKGFSRLVGLPHEIPGLSLEEEKTPLGLQAAEESPNEPKSGSYKMIQNLLQTIGLKLSSGDVNKLATQAQEQIYSSKSSSKERESASLPREELKTSRTVPVESDNGWSSPARSSSLEPLNKAKTASSYQGYLEKQKGEVLKKTYEMQHHATTTGSTFSTLYSAPPTNFLISTAPNNNPPQTAKSTDIPALKQPGPPPGPPPRRPPGPPPRPPPRCPPGPPPGPPPRHIPEQPVFASSSYSDVPFLGQITSQPANTSGPSQLKMPVTLQSMSNPNEGKATISTTVARCLKVIETVKSLAVQSQAKSSKSVKFTIPIEPSSPVSVDAEQLAEDIQAKQKEKLDLYNQRISEKREQQFKEMLARKRERKKNEDGPPSIEKPLSSEQKHVWICGHSLVFWAESRAKSPEVGMQLGMDPRKVSVWWKGVQGMMWSQLLPQLHQLKVTWPNPDVLILHLGGNDLSTDSPTDLLSSVKKDLTSMRSIFPHCLLVWSNILPRRMWRHCPDSQEVDLVRSTVNRRIQNIVAELGGSSLSHENIRCGANTGMYRSDGVHLSPKGIDVFNLNLQDFLEKWELITASESS